mmetsp:Transcript_173300/g.555855  ORF Transcript_173300/g.555855 Transcript_173300/m.555855 type:complete len:209 (+) Transcript_173300:135-761(+)
MLSTGTNGVSTGCQQQLLKSRPRASVKPAPANRTSLRCPILRRRLVLHLPVPPTGEHRVQDHQREDQREEDTHCDDESNLAEGLARALRLLYRHHLRVVPITGRSRSSSGRQASQAVRRPSPSWRAFARCLSRCLFTELPLVGAFPLVIVVVHVREVVYLVPIQVFQVVPGDQQNAEQAESHGNAGAQGDLDGAAASHRRLGWAKEDH